MEIIHTSGKFKEDVKLNNGSARNTPPWFRWTTSLANFVAKVSCTPNSDTEWVHLCSYFMATRRYLNGYGYSFFYLFLFLLQEKEQQK